MQYSVALLIGFLPPEESVADGTQPLICFFIMIVLIGDAESVCDMKECSDSYSTVVTG